MRKFSVRTITRAIRDLSIKANTALGPDALNAFQRALQTETSCFVAIGGGGGALISK